MSRERTKHLIFVSNDKNNYKFYRLHLDANGVVTKNWGRVGATGQTQTEHTGQRGFEKILNDKLRKGYEDVDIVAFDTAVTPGRPDSAELAVAARVGLVTKPVGRGSVAARAELDKLIDRLVAANAHDILQSSGGYIKVDTAGIIQTPMGIVSSRSLNDARNLLEQMRDVPAGPALTRQVEKYLALVPQKVSSRAGWADRFFTGDNTIDTQLDLIEKLAGAVSFAATAREAAVKAAAKAAKSDTSVYADLFRLKVSLLTDKAEFARIEKLYESGKNRNHTGYNLKLKQVFVLKDTDEANAAYEARATEIGNRKTYWHGTRASNLLSILQKGFIVPPTRGSKIPIAGRMFGDGTYFSSQSTKSLQYSSNSGLRGRDSERWMILSEVAAGSEYRPVGRYNDHEARHGKNKFGRQWDSINVRPGTAGVLNHEAVIFRDNQISPRFLCEFGA